MLSYAVVLAQSGMLRGLTLQAPTAGSRVTQSYLVATNPNRVRCLDFTCAQ